MRSVVESRKKRARCNTRAGWQNGAHMKAGEEQTLQKPEPLLQDRTGVLGSTGLRNSLQILDRIWRQPSWAEDVCVQSGRPYVR
jgi:hypothetical protein